MSRTMAKYSGEQWTIISIHLPVNSLSLLVRTWTTREAFDRDAVGELERFEQTC